MNEIIIFSFFGILFIVFAITFGIKDIKHRKLVGIKKIITFLIYLFFGLSMALMMIFVNINWVISILIFLVLFLVCIISSIKNNGLDIINLDLLVLIIVGIVCCLCGFMNISINNILWVVLGIGIYILPGLGYFSGKMNLIKKMKRCIKEVDAKIIDVKKGRIGRNHSVSVYIPVFEFILDGKKYEVMDTSSIYSSSRKRFKIGNDEKLFVNPNNPQINGPNGCDDVFWPGNLPSKGSTIPIIMFYVSTILTFLLVMYLYSTS